LEEVQGLRARGEALSGAITWDQILFFFGLLSLVAGIWWRVEGKIDKAKLEASTVAAANALASLSRQELADHRLHVSEVYATKQGMQEQTSQLLRAIEGVGNRIDGMNERLDRAFENTAAAPARRRAT
jgi:hypothetical protein